VQGAAGYEEADAGAGSDCVESRHIQDRSTKEEQEIGHDHRPAWSDVIIASFAQVSGDRQNEQSDGTQGSNDEQTIWVAGPDMTASVLAQDGIGSPVGVVFATPVSATQGQGGFGRQGSGWLADDVVAVAQRDFPSSFVFCLALDTDELSCVIPVEPAFWTQVEGPDVVGGHGAIFQVTGEVIGLVDCAVPKERNGL